MCKVIVIIYIIGSYTDGFSGYYSARPTRCGTILIIFKYKVLIYILFYVPAENK